MHVFSDLRRCYCQIIYHLRMVFYTFIIKYHKADLISSPVHSHCGLLNVFILWDAHYHALELNTVGTYNGCGVIKFFVRHRAAIASLE